MSNILLSLVVSVTSWFRHKMYFKKVPIDFFDPIPYLSDKKRIREHTINTPHPIPYQLFNGLTKEANPPFRVNGLKTSQSVHNYQSIHLRTRRCSLYSEIDSARYQSEKRTLLFKLITDTYVKRP